MSINEMITAIDLSSTSVVLRLVLAVLVGGIIGMEREHKHRPAGFRTHILVCLGAALTSVTGLYLCREYLVELVAGGGTVADIVLPCDPLRMSAQVIAGIGFIGAGSIIVTRRSQVKGLTTAAGLWTTAIVGIAIGVGFYIAVAFTAVLILVAELILSKLEVFIATKAREVNLYVEYESVEVFAGIKSIIEDKNAKILQMELAKTKGEGRSRLSVILSMQFNGKSSFEEITTELARLEGIYSVQEL